MSRAPWLVAIYGPTASGKTWLAESLADRRDTRIVNADAFQVCKGLDIGTAKPREKSRYELLDLVEPAQDFSVVQWIQLAQEVLWTAWDEDKDIVLVGGTGFYMRALLEGYESLAGPADPALRQRLADDEAAKGLPHLVDELMRLDPIAHAKTDLANPVRVRRAIERALSPGPPLKIELPAFSIRKFATWPLGTWHPASIENRVDEMLARGWIEEVRSLLARGVSPEDPGMRAIGYHTLVKHLEGEVSAEEARESIVTATKQYARRQKTWLRREPRIEFLNLPEGSRPDFDRALAYVCSRLESLESKESNG